MKEQLPFIVLLLYVAVVTIILGWQSSISATYKNLPKPYSYIFIGLIFYLAFSVMLIWRTNAMVAMGFGFMFVGCFPRFYDDQSIQHYLGALVVILGGMWEIGVNREHWYLPIIWLAGVGLLRLIKAKNFTLWVEMLAFSIIYVGLNFKNLFIFLIIKKSLYEC